MPVSDKNFTGSIPDIYDSYLVPLIFEEFASDMAARVAKSEPERVLETAAGSGVVTRALAPLLGSEAQYVVTDLNQPMLDRAAAQQSANDSIVWQAADATSLPFDDNSFDAACCQFGVMFFPDQLIGYREIKRVLHRGGTYVFNVWDKIEENIFADIVTKAVSELYPDDPPLFLARTPHGYFDIKAIMAELFNAGFSNVEVTTKQTQSTASDPMHPAIAYCQGTPLRNEILARDPDGLDRATKHAGARIANFIGTGKTSAKIQGHIFVATV